MSHCFIVTGQKGVCCRDYFYIASVSRSRVALDLLNAYFTIEHWQFYLDFSYAFKSKSHPVTNWWGTAIVVWMYQLLAWLLSLCTCRHIQAAFIYYPWQTQSWYSVSFTSGQRSDGPSTFDVNYFQMWVNLTGLHVMLALSCRPVHVQKTNGPLNTPIILTSAV